MITPWMTLAQKPSLSRKMREEWDPKPALHLCGQDPGANVEYVDGDWELDSLTQEAGPVKLGTEVEGRAPVSNFIADSKRWGSVSYGKWYFEVVIRTAGRMLIGWGDRSFGLKMRTEEDGSVEVTDAVTDAGLDSHSWVWDGRARRAYHDGVYHPWGVRWKIDDVIGCLLDCDKGVITFTRNGVAMGLLDSSDGVPAFSNLKFESGLAPIVAVVEGEQQLKVNIGRSQELHGQRYRVHLFRPFYEAGSHFQNLPGEQCSAVQTFSRGYTFDAVKFSELLTGRPNEIVGAWRSPGSVERGLTTADPTRLRLISKARALEENLWTFAPWERDFLKLANAWCDICNLQRGFRGSYGRHRALRTIRVVLRDERNGRHERVIRASITVQAVARGVLVRRMIRAARHRYLLQVLRYRMLPQFQKCFARLDVLAQTDSGKYLFDDIAWTESVTSQMAVVIMQRSLRRFQARDHFIWLSSLDKLRRQWEDACRQERLRARLERDNPRRIKARDLFVGLQWQKKKADMAQASLDSTIAAYNAKEFTSVATLNAWHPVKDLVSGLTFFRNELTGEESHDPPDHWRDHYLKGGKLKLVFWKNLDEGKDISTQTMRNFEVLCRHCQSRNNERYCSDCESAYCMDCFIHNHRTPAARRHTFELIEPRRARVLKCAVCVEESLAELMCDECRVPYCKACFHRDHSHEVTDTEHLTVSEVNVAVERARNSHVSREFHPGTPICLECDRNFATIRTYGDPFCADCYASKYKDDADDEGLETIEPWVTDTIKDGDIVCSQCELRKADRVCNDCMDAFCAGCFSSVHRTGYRRRHHWTPWSQSALSSGWDEIWDDESQSFVYKNVFTGEMRTTKPPELLLDQNLTPGVQSAVRQKDVNLMKARSEEQVWQALRATTLFTADHVRADVSILGGLRSFLFPVPLFCLPRCAPFARNCSRKSKSSACWN